MDIVIDGINFQNLSAFSQWKIHQFTENLTLIQYIGNILHLFVNLYFNYGIWKTSLMHPNMKILVITISSQYSVIAIGRIGETVNSKILDDKPIIMTNLICVFFKIVTDTALVTSCTSMVLIGIERVITMVYRKGKVDANGYIGSVMLIYVVLFGSFFSLSTLLYDIFVAETFDLLRTETSCQNLYTHPLILPLCWCFAAVTFVVGTLMLYYVYHHNKAMIANYQNFAIRYQFSESNETLRVLLPAVAGYGVMILIGSGFSFYSIYTIISTEQNSFDVQMTFQLLYMLADFYGIYFVLYFFVRFRPMKKRLRNHIRWIFKLPQNVANTIKPIDRADGQHQADEYFQQLSNAWNLKVEEKERKVKKAKKNQIKNGKKAFLSEERSTV